MKRIPKRTHTIKDIWEAYSASILKENPDWWSVKKHGYEKVKNFFIYRTVSDRNGKHVEEVISYPKFRRVLEFFLDRAKKEIIRGNSVKIPHCGRIFPKRVQRDFRKNRQRNIDWFKTNQQEKVFSKEKQKMVPERMIYHVGDEWCRIAWHKPIIHNDLVYEFKPSASSSTKSPGGKTMGFSAEFAQAHVDNPFLKYNYLYEPIKNYPKEKRKYHDLSVNKFS